MNTHSSLTILFVFASASIGYSDIVVTGNVQGGTGQLTITNDLSYDISFAGTVTAIVFDEWVNNDNTRTFSVLDGGDSSFRFHVNGGAVQTNTAKLADNSNASFGVVTGSDGYILIEQLPAVQVGDVFTVKSGTYDLGSHITFNSALNDSTFRGTTFLTDNTGVRLSEFRSAVPESSAFANALLLFVVGMSYRRSRWLTSHPSTTRER